MSDLRRGTKADEIRGLIEQVDSQLREAERVRSYVNEARRQAFFPDRRQRPRIPECEGTPSHDDRA